MKLYYILGALLVSMHLINNGLEKVNESKIVCENLTKRILQTRELAVPYMPLSIAQIINADTITHFFEKHIRTLGVFEVCMGVAILANIKFLNIIGIL